MIGSGRFIYFTVYSQPKKKFSKAWALTCLNCTDIKACPIMQRIFYHVCHSHFEILWFIDNLDLTIVHYVQFIDNTDSAPDQPSQAKHQLVWVLEEHCNQMAGARIANLRDNYTKLIRWRSSLLIKEILGASSNTSIIKLLVTQLHEASHSCNIVGKKLLCP